MTSKLFQVTWRLDGREDSPRETYVFGEDMLGALAFFQRVFREEQPLAVKEVTVLFSHKVTGSKKGVVFL